MNPIREDFDAAAGQRIQTCRHQLAEHVFQRLPGLSLDLDQFDHRKRFDMDVRAYLFDGTEQIEIVLVGQARIDAADHVDFGDRHVDVRSAASARTSAMSIS